MPRVIVEMPIGTSSEVIEAIRGKIKIGVHEILATKDPKYDYVAVREVHAEIGNGSPFVAVDLRPGRSAEAKRAFVDLVVKALEETSGIAKGDTYVLFRESEAPNHYCGGYPIGPFDPPG